MLQKDVRRGRVLFLTGLAAFLFLFSYVPSRAPYGLAAKSGLIIYGTDNPWLRADIGIKDESISKIGCIDKNQNNYLWERQK
jgi:hypothetical protein